MSEAPTFCAIDIGTVTTRMLLAKASGIHLHELNKQYRITNLGEGVDATGRLTDAAIQRVVDAVSDYLRIRDSYATPDEPIIPTFVAATSASRDAANADEFAARLAAIGATLNVIPGEREAALSFLGATADAPGQPAIVVDIGGGSTEAIAGYGGEDPLFVHSFDVGCRRMTERYLEPDQPSVQQLSAAGQWARELMEPVLAQIDESFVRQATVLAVAGTATSVVSIREEMEVYDSARVHGTFVSRKDLATVHELLVSLTLDERKELVGLDPGRADVIIGGTLILATILHLLGKDGYVASESDILQGLIWSMATRGTIS